MPGNSVSPRWILHIRLARSSSLTERLADLASGKELCRSAPRVRGNSCVALDKQAPSDGDCSRPAASPPVPSITMAEVATQVETETPTRWTRFEIGRAHV